MGATNTLKTLIIALVMAALAFVVGSMAADGKFQTSMMPIAGIVGLFALLYLGKNCWWLVFIVPALSSFLPIPPVFGLPLTQLTAAVVFAYWLVMWVMNYVQIKWKDVIWVDGPVFLFCAYFAYTYVMHPVGIAVLGDSDSEFIGGKDYIFMLLGLLTYCAISLIPCSLQQLFIITKWTIAITVVLGVFFTLVGTADLGTEGIAQGAERGRFGLFSGLGAVFLYILCSWNSPTRLLTSPKKICLLLLSLFALAMAGWREKMLSMGVFFAVTAVAYRQLYIWIVVGAASLGGLYYLSSQEVLMEAPYGVQRVLTPLPGLKLKKEIVLDASHSSEWRKEMWRWALNPRMGYIHDYVWGDGFGVSKTNLRLTTINMNRGKMGIGNQEFFAETGTWHSGVIVTIHRIGYVGLVLVGAWILASICLILRLGMCLRGNKAQGYALYLTAGYVGFLALFCISAGTYSEFFRSIVSLALAKIMYYESLKEGLIPPMFARKVYVPLMMQESEEIRRRSRQVVQVIERN